MVRHHYDVNSATVCYFRINENKSRGSVEAITPWSKKAVV
jgi:hypothetical protein